MSNPSDDTTRALEPDARRRITPTPLVPCLRHLLVGPAAVLLIIVGVEQVRLTPSFPMTVMLMQTQDVPVLVPVAALLLALSLWPKLSAWGERGWRLAGASPAVLAVPIAFAVVVAGLGTRYVVADTPVSHDENMSKFDTDIIASGRIMAPIAPEWRSLSWTLKPAFRLPVPGDVAWVSTYLPGNAAIRAVLSKVLVSPGFANACMVGIALLALLAVARDLFPARRDTWLVAVVLAATSSQVLGMGMTPFAMTAHLALNLIWLWLHLRNSAVGHGAAIAVGFVATGLHQLIFHPLFVAPFILQMLFDRRWRLAAVYCAGYAAIGLFWIFYWQLLLALHGIAPQAASALGASFFVERVASMLRDFSILGLEVMVQNLLRFAAWQNPWLLVLLAPGLAAGWRAGGVLRSLVGGIALTLLTMLVLLPYQDIGWGYRYLHGLIGNAALLAAAGWVSLVGGGDTARDARMWGVAAVTTIAAVAVLLPIHVLQMHAYISPYTRANAAIAASRSEAVVIETISVGHGIELIRNDPYLRNRPLIVDIGLLDMQLARELCSRLTVTVFDGAEAERFGMERFDPKRHDAYPKIQPIREFLESQECRRLRGPG